jgi:2'-5' RNA ligase
VPRRRLGVALLLPDPVSTEVDALRRAVGGAEGVARVPPHLTLVPPVNVHEERLAEAVALLERAAASTRPFRVTLGPAATFLPANPVLFLEVGGDVGTVHALRDRVFVEPLARPLTWPFAPHVTLLDQGEPDRVAVAATALGGYVAEVVVDRVHLLEERRDAAGARMWRPLADAGLRAPAVVGRGGRELVLHVGELPSPEVAAFAAAEWARYDTDRYGPRFRKDPLTVSARREGRVVGVAEGDTRPDTGEAYLRALLVGADVRGEGVGAHLLARFAAAAAERGSRRLTLRTEAAGPAERFYRRLGFEPWYVMPEWRAGRDWVQLRRDL